jgi:hypothetical protein
MRRAALLLMVFSTAVVARVQAAERVLSIETEVVAPKDRSLGKTQTLVAARGTERVKGAFGGLTLVLDVDVGPTFDKDCNLVTITGRLEDTEPEGKARKIELKTTTIHACGASTQATIPNGSTNRVVVTVRPGP